MYLRYCHNSRWLGQTCRRDRWRLSCGAGDTQLRPGDLRNITDVGQPELGEARSTYHALCWILTAISSPYDDLSPHSGPVAECRKQAYISGSPSRARLAYSQEET